MQKHAVIVAGGSGTRLGGGLPKQFQPLCGRPMLWWALNAFADEDNETVIHLVLPEAYIPLWKELESSLPESDRIPLMVHSGGATRTESVVSALSYIASDENILIAVHDAARPVVDKSMIERGWKTAGMYGAAVPVVPVTDSLRCLQENGGSVVADRSRYVAVQTPQVFRANLLKDAYKKIDEGNFTDDASVVEFSGTIPYLYEGGHDNIKVTNPGDMEIAAILLQRLKSSQKR